MSGSEPIFEEGIPLAFSMRADTPIIITNSSKDTSTPSTPSSNTNNNKDKSKDKCNIISSIEEYIIHSIASAFEF
jgi:hypothetical protein